MIKVIPLGARVAVTGKLPRNGTVVAYFEAEGIGFLEPKDTFAAVILDEGFWSKDERTFVRVLVVHPENMKELE